MASFSTVAARLFFLFCLLLACSSPQAQARDSQFFSKAGRYDTANEAAPAKEDLPPAKKEEPVQYKPDTAGNGFGLYGHGPEKLPPATAGSTPSFPAYNYNNNNAGDNFNAENVPSEFNSNKFSGVSYANSKEFNTAGYPDNNNKNYYANNKPAYKAGDIPENELNGGSYYKDNSKEPNARYPSYANQREQYGMSDTRLQDNGRYFYDLNAEESYRNGARYDAARGNPGDSNGSSGGRGESFNANGGYPYGNNYNNEGNGYEENNSMQGYQNSENTQEKQEEYVP